jgi:hypothetical protein
MFMPEYLAWLRGCLHVCDFMCGFMSNFMCNLHANRGCDFMSALCRPQRTQNRAQSRIYVQIAMHENRMCKPPTWVRTAILYIPLYTNFFSLVAILQVAYFKLVFTKCIPNTTFDDTKNFKWRYNYIKMLLPYYKAVLSHTKPSL